MTWNIINWETGKANVHNLFKLNIDNSLISSDQEDAFVI